MKIRVLAPIRNTIFDFPELSVYGNVKIINGEVLNNKINLSKAFKETIGTRNLQLLKTHFLFYYEGEANELLDPKIYNNIVWVLFML